MLPPSHRHAEVCGNVGRDAGGDRALAPIWPLEVAAARCGGGVALYGQLLVPGQPCAGFVIPGSSFSLARRLCYRRIVSSACLRTPSCPAKKLRPRSCNLGRQTGTGRIGNLSRWGRMQSSGRLLNYKVPHGVCVVAPSRERSHILDVVYIALRGLCGQLLPCVRELVVRQHVRSLLGGAASIWLRLVMCVLDMSWKLVIYCPALGDDPRLERLLSPSPHTATLALATTRWL